jgi:hypothetical protein
LIVNAVACWVRNREQENFLVKTSEKYAEVIFLEELCIYILVNTKVMSEHMSLVSIVYILFY